MQEQRGCLFEETQIRRHVQIVRGEIVNKQRWSKGQRSRPVTHLFLITDLTSSVNTINPRLPRPSGSSLTDEERPEFSKHLGILKVVQRVSSIQNHDLSMT